MTDPVSDTRLKELDALRGIAALVVVLFHYTHYFTVMFPGQPHAPLQFTAGKHGVLLFFAISGFVIFLTLARTRQASDFIVSRFARLFPVYWAAIIVTSLVVGISGIAALQVSPITTAVNVTMLQSFLRVPSVDGVYWTLSVELAFYACMLALWFTGLTKRIECVIVFWLALKWLWWLMPQLSWLAGVFIVQNWIPFFVIGILAYRTWSGDRTPFQQVPVLAWALLTIGVIDGIEIFVVALIVAAIFTVLALRVWRLGVPAVLIWLGSISYALYLVHQHIGYVIMILAEARGFPPMVAVGIALVATLLLAWLLTAWVEQPALFAIRRCWKERKSR